MSTLFNTKTLHIELSSKCTLKCPRCPRTELKPETLNREITLVEFQKAFDLTSIESISFSGDIGDPIYAKDFLDICKHIKSTSDVTLRITTNGSYKDADWWQQLGQILTADDRITFSVDGWDQDSNEKYRVNSNFDSILIGAKNLRAVSQCWMMWSTIYFNFNEQHIDRIRDLAKTLGFDGFKTVRSSKFDGRYSVDGVDYLKPTVDNVSKTAGYEMNIVEFTRPKPKDVEKIGNQHPWAKCLNGNIEIFINVDGFVFPCAWFNSGYYKNTFVEQHKDRINIKTRSLNEIMADPLWDELISSFETSPLPICRLKCKNE
jgi:MoaA/NifB/PqqE/SkfB family radical SAM enzyme